MKKKSIFLCSLIMIAVFACFTNVEAKSDTELWNEFVEEFKASETVKNQQEVEITSTDTSLKIVITGSRGHKYDTNFTYENGVISFVPSTGGNSAFDNMWIENCLETIAIMKGYDAETLKDWVDKNKNNSTLENDGIQQKNEGGNISSLNVSLKNGITGYEKEVAKNEENKNEENISGDINHDGIVNEEDCTKKTEVQKEQVVKNPKTGVMTVSIGLISLLFIGMIIYLKTKKYSKFPQA